MITSELYQYIKNCWLNSSSCWGVGETCLTPSMCVSGWSDGVLFHVWSEKPPE